MNSDEIMSDPAGPMHSAEDQNSKAGGWNTKKFRDEYEMHRHRLHDKAFSSYDYPDPLTPRPPHPKQYPRGTSTELESKLLKLIANVKKP
ncbi:hypothetical protein N0V88_004179 [Collariella sp. IMI 366227]|nr:hypothetical protein N0V88_004179 [Collariella sp. IMI 366227]